MTYRVLIAAAVPILGLLLATLGRTGADARDITGLDTARRPAGGLDRRTPLADVQLPPPRRVPSTEEPLLLRNPFEFAPRAVSPSPPPLPVPLILVPPPERPPDLPPDLTLSLIGVATTSRADGRAERTAIIAGPAETLYMVRDGDVVTTRYRVDAVLAESVRLVDAATGASLSLVIR